MDALNNKLVLVTRKTRLEELIARFNTIDQAKFYVEHLGADFGDYEAEHRIYQAAIRESETILGRFGRVQRLDRAFLTNFIFPNDMPVVVVGQDGLVANTLKYLKGQRVIAVNPDPQRWDGVLLPFEVDDLAHIAPETLAGKRPTKKVTMARARLSDGQQLLAVNDFFIGARTHVSARYRITSGKKQEQHSSSGVIVSTGLGSSGWFRSVLTGACGIAHTAPTDLKTLRESGFSWDSEFLYFSVREPFPSRITQTDLVFGQVSERDPLRILSNMPENGVIFSDGVEADFLQFNSGIEAAIDVAEQSGYLVQ